MAKYEPMLNLTIQRKKAGIKQKELAKSLGVLPNTISGYETGQCAPSLDMLKKLAAALNCESKDLI